MLVLTRREGDAIRISAGDELIRVRLLKIKGNTVRVGIIANKNVKILRDELDEHGRSITTDGHATTMGE